jgi:CRP-like cAMP-binding protein
MGRNVKILDRRAIQPGTIVFEQGSEGTQAFLIESGKVEVFIKDHAGQIVNIAEVGAGSLIGEMAVISGGKRTASVRTLETTVLITLSAHDLQEVMNTSGNMYTRMMRMMMNRLHDTHRKLVGKELTEVEKTVQTALENIEKHAPKTRQTEFTSGLGPIVDKLKKTLDRFGRS